MPKVLRCGDVVPGCSAVIEGKDEAEVMTKGAEHAKTAHKMMAIPPRHGGQGQGGYQGQEVNAALALLHRLVAA